VIGFLLLSGYSIAASLDREQEGFYRRRFLRIYPLYFFSILFAVILEAWLGGHIVMGPNTYDSLGYMTALGNLFFLQTFLVKPVQSNLVVWSLAIEVFYYVLAPLFARLPRQWLLAIIAFSSLCYALPEHSDWGLVYLVLCKFKALNYLWCWLLGFMLWRDRSPLTIALALVGIPQLILGADTPQVLAVATYILVLTLIFAAGHISLSKWFKAFANYLGDISYPLYLLHLPTLIFCYSTAGIRSPSILVLLMISKFMTAVTPRFVIPAKAGIQGLWTKRHWIPAFARMTNLCLVLRNAQ
jgi:peptidoglycan/LPS O-acetylase OafA/YrhL